MAVSSGSSCGSSASLLLRGAGSESLWWPVCVSRVSLRSHCVWSFTRFLNAVWGEECAVARLHATRVYVIHRSSQTSGVFADRHQVLTTRSACNSSSSLVSVVPVARRTRLAELCPDTKHRSQSVESFTFQRFRPDVARVHISLD